MDDMTIIFASELTTRVFCVGSILFIMAYAAVLALMPSWREVREGYQRRTAAGRLALPDARRPI